MNETISGDSNFLEKLPPLAPPYKGGGLRMVS
jgi:hypothetical protein